MINPLDRNFIPQEPVVKMVEDFRRSTKILRAEVGRLQNTSPEASGKLVSILDATSRDIENNFREYCEHVPRDLPYVTPENVTPYRPITFSLGKRLKILLSGRL